MAIEGIDVSNNNGAIDWGNVAAGGKEFAVIKATEGLNFTDQDFDYNWREAKAHGLVRGAYHFARPSEGTGRQEALYFLSRVVEVIEVGDFLALDLEDTRVAANADLLAYALDFLRRIEDEVGFKAMLYSGNWYMAPHNLEGQAELAEYGLWYASYQPAPPPTPANWPFTAMWQYSASSVVPGIQGVVDLDRFNGTVDQLRQYGRRD